MTSPATPATVQWRSWHKLAWSIRVATVLVPFVLATVAMVVTAHVLPRPGSGPARIGWYLLLLAISWLVARLVGRGVDRSLPLAALLEMSLTFPESAPSRLGLAQKVSSAAALAQLSVAPPDETAQAAAERILRLMTALSAHDRFTRGHAERVRAYVDLIAERLEMSPADRDRLGWAALLHDIGKLRVPSQLLGKAGKPTATEWAVLRQHPAAGAVIAGPLLSWLAPMERVIAEHHERWDGSGYPEGLSGEQISFGARVVTVADSFEAMTAARPYSRPMRRDAALREVVACAGTHFDPEVVRALLTVPHRRLAWAMGPAAWLTGLPLAGQGPITVVRTAASHAGTLTAGATVVVAAAVAPASLIGQSANADAGVPSRTAAAHPAATSSHHPKPPVRTAAPTKAARTAAPATAAPTAAVTSAAPTRPATPAPTPTSTKPKPGPKPVKKPVAATAKPKPTAPAPAGLPATNPGPPTPAAPVAAPPAAPQPAESTKPAKPTPAPKPTPVAKPTKAPKPAKPTPADQPTAAPKPTPAPKPTKPPKGGATGNAAPTAAPTVAPTTAPAPPAPTPVNPPPAQAPAATLSCSASYVVTSGDHGDSFSAAVTVRNTGTATTHGWTVSWQFGGKEEVQSFDGARVQQSGQSATAGNLSYNGTLAPGASTQFWVQGKRKGATDQPTLSCTAT